MEIQTNHFLSLSCEIIQTIFTKLNPKSGPILALVCKLWKHIIYDRDSMFSNLWKKEFTLQGYHGKDDLQYKCYVIDYTGIASVSYNGSENRGFNVDGKLQIKLLPKFYISIGNHLLRNDRHYLQPGFDLLVSKDSICYDGSDSIEIRRISNYVIQIIEHNSEEGMCTQYVDTSYEYKYNDTPYFFVYPYHPTDISSDLALERYMMFNKVPSDILSGRCIYNRFGIIIEGKDKNNKYRLFICRPKEETFRECDYSRSLAYLVKNHALKSSEENVDHAKQFLKCHKPGQYKNCKNIIRRGWSIYSKIEKKEALEKRLFIDLFHNFRSIPNAYYGDIKTKDPIITNYYTGRSINPYINGVKAETLIQYGNYSIPVGALEEHHS